MKNAGLSLPDVIHRFKTMTTKRYTGGVKQNGWSMFSGKLWQHNYCEHIIRDENELNRIRQYIMDNPVRWDTDLRNLRAMQPSGIIRKNFEELEV